MDEERGVRVEQRGKFRAIKGLHKLRPMKHQVKDGRACISDDCQSKEI